MSVTEKLMAPGNFNVNLDMTLVPNSVVNAIQPYDHIVVMPTRIAEDELDDAAMIDSSEYIGIIQGLEIDEDSVVVEGTGLVAYLGDSDTRGLPIAEKGGLSSVRKYKEKTLEFVLDNTNGTPFGLLREGNTGAKRAIVKGTVTNPVKENTQLLLNFEGSDGDTTTTDASNNSHVITFFDNAEISSSQSKYGNTSLSLTDEDDHLQIDYSNLLNVDDRDFTIEWWEYRLAP
jgi:hypothetical protein